MKCKFCGQEIDEGSVFCGYCGKEQPKVKKCIKCGHEIDIDDAFCGYCGASQVDGIKEASVIHNTPSSTVSSKEDEPTNMVEDEKVERQIIVENKEEDTSEFFLEEVDSENVNKPNKIILWVIAALLLGVVGIGYFWYNKNASEEESSDYGEISTQAEDNSTTDGQEAIDFLKTFYNDAYREDEVLRKYITNKAKKVLNDYYGYDCDGDCLATWLFDSNGECDSKSVQSFTLQSSNQILVENKLSCGTYYVLLTLVRDGESFKIDNIEPIKYVDENGTYEYGKEEITAKIDFLEQFYSGLENSHNDEEYVRNFITPNAEKILKEAYDYDCDDGNCLATWLFTHEAELGSPISRKIVEKDKNHFHVKIKYKSEEYNVLLTVIKVDDTYKIDNIEKK